MCWLTTGIDVSVFACTGTFVQVKAPEVGRDLGHVVPVSLIIPTGVPGYGCTALTVAGAAPAIDGLDEASAGADLTLTGGWSSGSNGEQRMRFLVDGVAAPSAPCSGLTDHAVTVVIPGLPNPPPAPSGHTVEVVAAGESGSSPQSLLAHRKGAPRLAGCSDT
jgi:hypothetical protein